MSSVLTFRVAIAQSSLAEILLRLNTGLVGIITTFLHREKPGNLELDYRSLTDLSEQSREQTVGVLRQLYQRLLSRQTPARLPAKKGAVKRKPLAEGNVNAGRKAHRTSPKHSKIRGPTLARVVIQNSSKPSQIALVRPSEVKRSSRSSSHSRPAPEAETPPSQAATAIAASQLSLPPTLPPEPMPWKPTRPGHARSKTSPEIAQKPSRRRLGPRQDQAAGGALSSEALRATKSTPKLAPALQDIYGQSSPPPRPPPVVENTTMRRRKETPTFYSMASGSTKLGEIPMHKWAEPYDFDAMSLKNREAMASGWPRLEEGGVEKKKRGGLFRLFRRRSETTT